MRRCQRYLVVLPAAILICVAAQAALGAGEPPVPYEFLAELAALKPVPGYPPQLFRPEHQPSRYEVAYFLYLLDQQLAAAARPERLDLEAVLARIWRTANPGAGPGPAASWARTAALRYRRLLLTYHHEMRALGFQLRPDAYPDWSWSGDDARRH
ncbi:MAG: hypothetical protein ACM3XS_10440 [Bacteroidota bacterium]